MGESPRCFYLARQKPEPYNACAQCLETGSDGAKPFAREMIRVIGSSHRCMDNVDPISRLSRTYRPTYEYNAIDISAHVQATVAEKSRCNFIIGLQLGYARLGLKDFCASGCMIKIKGRSRGLFVFIHYFWVKTGKRSVEVCSPSLK